MIAVGLVVVSYLVGTVPTAAWVGRRLGHDPTRGGSGNPGASNTYRVAGAGAGAIVLALDLAKGALPTLAGLAVSGRPLALACGAAAVVGHSLPVTRSWRGGRGVATAGGLAVVLWPVPTVVLAAVWLLAVRVSGRASVASLAVAVALPVGLLALGRPAWEAGGVAVLAVFVVVRHADNIGRLLRGNEPSLRAGRDA